MLLWWLEGQDGILEQQIRRALLKYAEADPVGAWSMTIVGIGPVIAAGLLALGLLATLLTLRYVLRPLRDLRQRAETMAVHATGEAISAHTRDEVHAVVEVLDDARCTVADRDLFSFRRDGVTGRQGMVVMRYR